MALELTNKKTESGLVSEKTYSRISLDIKVAVKHHNGIDNIIPFAIDNVGIDLEDENVAQAIDALKKAIYLNLKTLDEFKDAKDI